MSIKVYIIELKALPCR